MMRSVGRRNIGLAVCGILVSVVLASTAMAEPPKGWNWKLVWSDEFDGKTLDLTKWEYRTGQRRGGDWVTDTISLDGKGNLVMRAYEKNGTNYTGGLFTYHTFGHRYGYYEIRCQFPKNEGHWMSFWLQSYTLGLPPYSPGSTGTEVDIFEYDCVGTDRLSHNIHWGDYYDNHEHTGHISEVPGLQTGFHTVGLLWTENEYVIYADDKEVWRTPYGVSNQKEYVEITDEMLDGLPEGYKVKDDFLLVDYVRVYDIDNDVLKRELPKDGKFIQVEEITTSETGSLLLKSEILKNLPKVLSLPETTVRHVPLVEVKEGETVEKKLESQTPADGITDEINVKLLPWVVKDQDMGYIFNPLQLDTVRPIGFTTDKSGKKVPATRYDRNLTSRQFVHPNTWYFLTDMPAGDSAGQKRTIQIFRLLVKDSQPTTHPATQPSK